MDDGEFKVDILDKDGHIVGSKIRREIVKGQDIYHAVYCVVITPEKTIVLNKIAARTDLPNLHAGKLGCTCATIRRSNESGHDAAKRAVKNELYLDVAPELLAEDLVEIDGTYRKIGWYTVSAPLPAEYNHEDIEELVSFSQTDFVKLLEVETERITPPLKMFWVVYSKQ